MFGLHKSCWDTQLLGELELEMKTQLVILFPSEISKIKRFTISELSISALTLSNRKNSSISSGDSVPMLSLTWDSDI